MTLEEITRLVKEHGKIKEEQIRILRKSRSQLLDEIHSKQQLLDTTIEMNDPSARPAISSSVENMDQYDIVFLGYPIWLAYHNLIQCTQA